MARMGKPNFSVQCNVPSACSSTLAVREAVKVIVEEPWRFQIYGTKLQISVEIPQIYKPAPIDPKDVLNYTWHEFMINGLSSEIAKELGS